MAWAAVRSHDPGMALRRRVCLLALLTAAMLSTASQATAAGGRYTFAGGTPAQRAEVRAALNASEFDWSRVPAWVTIHIAPGEHPRALPGHIWLDANLLDAGRFSWAIVQHEYAHQVDFFLLDGPSRSILTHALGASAWCTETPGLPHSMYGCERFASTLTWAYWQSPHNVLRPESASDESAAMPPTRFRTLVSGLFRARQPS
jgi:hypothetical protein